MNTRQTRLDELDLALIAALRENPRASITSLANATGAARGTIYGHLERLGSRGVITGYGPEVDAKAAGFGVLAFCTLEIAQGTHDQTIEQLAAVTEIVEIHTVTGVGDLLLRIVAESNDHLHDLLQRITTITTVRRSQTQLALATPMRRSIAEVITSDG